MSDLISRKALIAEYDRVHIGEPGKARKLIEDAPAVREWIPVSERLPERRETVLVCDARVGYINAWEYLGRDEWLYDSSIWETKEITHWMPLPEPPKEGE